MTPIHFETIAINDSNLYYDSYVAIALPVVYPSPPLAMLIETTRRSHWNCPDITEQCVQYAKDRGLNVSGNAWTIKSNSIVPNIGGGVLLYNGPGHIAIVEEIFQNSILVSEKNFLECNVISTRSIQLNDEQIKGFIK